MKLKELFPRKPIIGMIHLAEGYHEDRIERAVSEIRTFEKFGVDAAIIENYHASAGYVRLALENITRAGTRLILGINVLPNDYWESAALAKEFGARFIQVDQVAGRYSVHGIKEWIEELDEKRYGEMRKFYPDIAVLGGVWPKYYAPVPGSSLEEDLKKGMERADAIVVTGEGTGKKTPTEKIREFRKIMRINRRNFPLILGAGLNVDNVIEQFPLVDGVIVGSGLKYQNDTTAHLDEEKIGKLMELANRIR